MGNGRLGGSVPEKPGRGEYAFACMYVCVCCCCVVVFTIVLQLHIFYRLDNYECNMYANKSLMFFNNTYPSKKKNSPQIVNG